MTLLTICRDVATDMGIVPPATIVGNQSVDARRLLRFAQRVGRDLAMRAPWQALRRQHVFTATANEVQANAIPSDFLYFSPETLWDRTNECSITGPVSPTEYQSRRITADASGTQRWFTRRGNDLLIWPIMGGGETLAFEYQSSSFCQSSSLVPQSAWLADTDTGRISEELITLGMIARFLEAEGQPFALPRAEFERRLAIEIRADAPDARVLQAADLFGGGRRFGGAPGDEA